jgi:exopolysaccharide biosynthesis predicted pyruvyltransferase EpsI
MWSHGELSPIADEKLIRLVQPGQEPPSPIKNLKRRLGFRRNLKFTRPEATMRFYSRFGALVASRLHSSILAISTGTPVITIEPSVFKLTAIFEQMSYPYGTEDPGAQAGQIGWLQRLDTR